MEESGTSHEGVAVHAGRATEAEHEWAVHLALAERLARLLGLEFRGRHSGAPPRRLYLVPINTVIGVRQARQLGIAGERDLFGGVVPFPFVATKSITHPLVDPRAHAPRGWSPEFARLAGDAVLNGYTAFSRSDAYAAGRRLLARGPVRVKSARANAGRGQWRVDDSEALARVLETLAEPEVANYGLVLEEHLEEVRTFSVGQVRVGELMASYYGTQHLTEDNHGGIVYGGSDLVVVPGGFDALRTLALPAEIALAVEQARAYDAAASASYPGFFASRRNYDVAQGLDAHGRPRSGVLEQSWRVGGASGAEVLALEAFASANAPRVVRASSLEIYGPRPRPPPGATVLFSGEDPEVGAIHKFVTMEPYERDE